jgi:hypothetical protein
MAYSLDTILAEVVANITAMTGSTAATHVIEAEGVERNVSPPYVVWLEGEQDSFSAPQLLGATSTTSHRNNPRALWTVATPVDIHLWATTKEQLENMLNWEIAALHRAVHGSYSIKSGTRVAANNSLMTKGEAYILSVEIRRPIVDVTHTVGKVTLAANIKHSTILDLPTDEDCGHGVITPS